jgi:hypothetical protein
MYIPFDPLYPFDPEQRRGISIAVPTEADKTGKCGHATHTATLTTAWAGIRILILPGSLWPVGTFICVRRYPEKETGIGTVHHKTYAYVAFGRFYYQ